jgi:2-amino-4-hydroxy-6-hydroxymethyldihydropteridine diphosphokinase
VSTSGDIGPGSNVGGSGYLGLGSNVGGSGYLGLGSNVGDRRGNLSAAVDALRGAGVEVLASSSVYETEPVGLVLDQPEFLNACLRVSVAAASTPLELLDLVKGLEVTLGRVQGGVRHGPRVIDIDVLLLDGVVLEVPRLTLPHPGVVERRFVLVPLLELDPELALPAPDGRRLADVLAGIGGQAVRVVGPPLV